MYYIIALLVVIAILLYLLFKKVSGLVTFLEEKFAYRDTHGDYNVKIKDWLRKIVKQLYEIIENTRNIDFALNCENPAGDNSANSKRLSALVKLYSNKLTEKKKLSVSEAEARSAFEFSAFDNDRLIEKINGGYWGSGWGDKIDKKEQIKKAFLKTGLLTKDCMAELQKLIPHDLCLPVWVLFNKYSSNLNIDNMIFRLSRGEKSYEDYVKNRAIILKLLDLGIITKGKSDIKDAEEEIGDLWLDYPCIKFQKNNLEEIKTILYNGKMAHDDDHFEEYYIKSEREHFFKDYSSL